MRKKVFKRFNVLVIAIAILFTFAVSYTIAYLVIGTDPIKNIFTASKVTTRVVEESTADNTVKNVKIANMDDTQAYIRAAVVINWKNSEGEVYAIDPVEGVDYNITWSGVEDNSWIKGNDGFYYYTIPVNPSATVTAENVTSILFTGVTVKNDTATVPDGYSLSVEVLGSGIQSTPAHVVTDEWLVELNGTTITAKN